MRREPKVRGASHSDTAGLMRSLTCKKAGQRSKVDGRCLGTQSFKCAVQREK